MSWQSTPLRGFRISARRAGSSPKAIAGASSASRCGSRGELDRGFEPLAMGERRAVRGRDLADLAGNDLQAAAVERAAERHRHRPRAVPAQLDDGRLVAGDVERGGKSLRRGAGVKDEIAIGRRRVGRGEVQAQRPGQVVARRIDVDERHLRAFDRARREIRPARRPRRRRPPRCARTGPAPRPTWHSARSRRWRPAPRATAEYRPAPAPRPRPADRIWSDGDAAQRHCGR